MSVPGAVAADAFNARAHSRLGQVLRGKWRLDRVLGIGGMATVYEATHRNGKRAALKLLHPELSADAEIRTRFLREGYVANKVDHPGAVSVLDDDSEEGTVFLVMELLEGEPLDVRASRGGGRLPVDEVLSVADQLLDVLASAHAHGIVHRDLKPENVFITNEGRVKILDFGIARIREGAASSTATRSGLSMGTPAYMAPEQARGLWNEVDARTDLWALGGMMFALIAGRHVHEGRTGNEVLLAAMTARAVPLSSVAPQVHPAVCALIDRAVAFDRDARWPDAPAMQTALRLAYQATQGSPIQTAPRLEVPAVDDAPRSVRTHAPTTGGAMSSGETGIGAGFEPGSRARRAAIVAIAAIAVAAAASVAARPRQGVDARGAEASASAAPSTAGSTADVNVAANEAADSPAAALGSSAPAAVASVAPMPSAAPAIVASPTPTATARPAKPSGAAVPKPKSDLLEKRR